MQGFWIWVWVLSSAGCNSLMPLADWSSKNGVANITHVVVEMYIEEFEGAKRCQL